ncbi:DUF397 domain-containing protein [Streptomyces flaveus]|uniref:DUF397 domain-containing protein n=1 Tax=Streptomyces flaveus TaxID=66370 RepID=A0A917RKC7_9ACTN|nr:DUF397 domain-containing protein [Streptomyces flaveus]GGL11964.1 hypothetical protein GCM10010094_86120 [Streptomyces flaveus]
MPELKWIKSSHSEASGNACVEVAENGPLIAVRDSKHPELPYATVGREAWGRFAGALVDGRLR